MAKIPDNYNQEFPARMADGRFMTDYSPNCDRNSFLSKEYDKLAIQNVFN